MAEEFRVGDEVELLDYDAHGANHHYIGRETWDRIGDKGVAVVTEVSGDLSISITSGEDFVFGYCCLVHANKYVDQ